MTAARLLSWNVNIKNRPIEAFGAFLRSVDADIYALQELTDTHVAALARWDGYRLYLADDYIEGSVLTRLGLLTRLPSRAAATLDHNPRRQISDSWLGRLMGWREGLQSHAIDVEFDGATVRVINLHLSAAVSPRRRMRELGEVAGHLPAGRAAVMAGDFNSYARPWLNALAGWFLGFDSQDADADDLRSLAAFAAGHGLKPAFAAGVTFPSFGFQLDHILVRGLRVAGRRRYGDTHGSDHLPLAVTLRA